MFIVESCICNWLVHDLAHIIYVGIFTSVLWEIVIVMGTQQMLIQPNETHFFREMSKGYFNLNMHNTTTTTRYDFPHWITWQNVSLKMFLLPISTTKKGNVIVHSSNNNVCKYLVKNSCSAFPFISNQLKKPIRYEWMKSKR